MTWVLHLVGLTAHVATVWWYADAAPGLLRQPSAEMDPAARRAARDELPARTPGAPIRRPRRATHLGRAVPGAVSPGQPPHPSASAPGRRRPAASSHPAGPRSSPLRNPRASPAR